MDTAMLKSNFPFTAVVGQSPVKLALTLLAINPAIGGVLVSGPPWQCQVDLGSQFSRPQHCQPKPISYSPPRG